MNVEKIKKKKLLVVLIVMTLISFVAGILFISILSDDNQLLVKSSVSNYFEGVSKGEFTYLKSLYSILSSNLLVVLFIWIIGISIVGCLLVGGVLIYKSFILGFSFTSILYTLGFKGFLIALIYVLPEILNLGITFILVYYSISFSLLLFNYLFRKKDYNRKVIVKRYLKLLVVCGVLSILSSLISVFLIPNILRVF